MSEQAAIVVDTNVLLNLATPLVDQRDTAPSGADPLRALLATYDVHIPTTVLGEVGDATGSDNLLSAAADTVLKAAHHLTTHDVGTEIDSPLSFGLDEGESHALWLANHCDAAMFVTDEFNTTNYLLVSLALEDRNTLFTTPHILCKLATADILAPEYVDAVLSYYVDTKHWDQAYIDRLQHRYL